MIQRVQTIYLLLAAICGFLLTRVPLYVATLTTGEDNFIATESLPMFAIGILAGLIAFVAIFLFKNRKMQIKFVLSGLLLSLGLLALIVYSFNSYSTTTPELIKASYAWGALIPIIMVILFILAWMNIRKDEKLIKSLDRLR